MATMESYNWDYENGVCIKHMLPCLPCPACTKDAKTDDDMYLQLDDYERQFADSIPMVPGFNPDVHSVY